MTIEKTTSVKTPLPLWYNLVISLGIPSGAALLGTPVYTMLKQFQNNTQLGIQKSVLSFDGLKPTASQMLMRSILRIGPVPIAKEFAKNHHPESMNPKTAQTVATLLAIMAGDIINTPTELTSTKQQTWKNSSGLPKPTLCNVWKNSDSAAQFVGKLYGFDGALRGGAAIAVALRAFPFVSALIIAKDQITKYIEPEGFKGKVAVDAAAGGVAMVVNTIMTPLSAVQQQTMRFDKPKSLNDALAAVLWSGPKNAYKGAMSRCALAGVSATITLGALAGQEAFANRFKPDNENIR
jgi:hypothetical protein